MGNLLQILNADVNTNYRYNASDFTPVMSSLKYLCNHLILTLKICGMY